MATFSVVEQILAGLFEVKDDARPALKARMRHLQRLGLSRGAGGSGRHVDFKLADVKDFALALSLAEIGLDPKVISGLVRPDTFDELMSDELGAFPSEKGDVFYLHYPAVFTTHKRNDGLSATLAQMEGLINNINQEPRLSIVNMSSLSRRIDAAFQKLGQV